MTVDDVVFQTNNVVGNFNYPPNVPAYKPIMKFLLNYPLNKAFTNCPSVVYQNFLKEFWSTVVAFDPFPSTDEPEKRPLREFLIKFSVLNEQRPLTRDLQLLLIIIMRILFTFVIQRFGWEYSPLKQSGELHSSLLATVLITGTKVDIGEIIYSDLDPSKVTDIELTAHMIAVNNRMDSVSPSPLAPKLKKGKDIQLASTGLHSTLDKGTRKSKPLPEGTATHPKDSGGNVQPLDRDLTFMNSDEGTAKTTPCPEGSRGDKDSRGNKAPTDMEPQNPTDADLLGTGAKYQEDQTQSSRLRYQSLTKNEGKTSSEVEPDTEPL
ncbi:hypothetical protein Tco_1204049 [Tanacetum coccineum]